VFDRISFLDEIKKGSLLKKPKRNKTDLARKMAAYTVTAFSALTVAQPATAAIQYNGPHNIPVPRNVPVSINLNGDANADFGFALISYTSTCTPNCPSPNSSPPWAMIAVGLSSAEFIYAKNSTTQTGVMNLPQGYNIKGTLAQAATRTWTSTFAGMAGSVYGSLIGNFTNIPGYKGVRFHSNACQGTNWHYGWIRINARSGPPASATIEDWAYETRCNSPIAAGVKPQAAQPVNVPTLDQWGMLALTALLSGAAILRMKKE
jgi:hypothetical protein